MPFPLAAPPVPRTPPSASGAPYRQCSISVLDTIDDAAMRFDDEGRCHYYHEYKAAERAHVRTGDEAARLLRAMVDEIQVDGRGKPYDCILGVSGGVDSTYVAYLAKQWGLRPLAVHFDNGWNSELAVKNIENIVNRLGIALDTYVMDWLEFKDLQLAYLKASVIDIEVLTDHAILATMYRLAAKHGIRHILSGTNVVTEQVLPPHWIYNKYDHVNIRAIHAAFGTRPLKSYPLMDWRIKRYLQTVRRLKSHSPLNLVPYDKAEVKATIQRELGWRDYGGKHYESIWTRFYQGYILPTKFGVDKRKAHLSNLIFSGQLTKAEAVSDLGCPIYDPDLLGQDHDFVLKKLELTGEQLAGFLAAPPRAHREFACERSVYDKYAVLRPFRQTIQRGKQLFGAA